MKHFILAVLLVLPSSLCADPHYVQALHPYWGNDKHYLEYLARFEGAVNVDVNKYEGAKDPDVGEDWYIYIVNAERADKLSLDISCPGAMSYEMHTFDEKNGGLKKMLATGVARIRDIIASDPVRKNPAARLQDGKLVWPLDASGGPQGMWFYSQRPPTGRAYELATRNGVVRAGSIDGPSCAN